MDNEFKIMQLEEEGNARWSELPTLFLWMIKDRLNLVDNVHLAAVCKDWYLASASYPPNPQQRLAPFLMHRLKDPGGCIFVNVSTMKGNLVCLIPEFQGGTSLLFSRRGWLLIGGVCDVDPKQSSVTVVLLHIQTDAKIVMPTLEEGFMGLSASFSSLGDGTPCCVVFAKCVEAQLTLYVANVGDEKWRKYSYPNGREINITASIVSGSKFYCLNGLGVLYTFDMTNLEWRKMAGSSKQCSMMESEEGAILKVDECKDSKMFNFFKLNESQSGWEELSENDVMGRSWFLSSTVDPNTHFTLMENARAKKVYGLSTYGGQGRDSSYIVGTHMSFNDLINKLTGTYELQVRGQWVDLGQIDKLPPSCVAYFPSPQV